MKTSTSPTIFRGFFAVVLFSLSFPLLWAQGWGDENPPVVNWINGLQGKAGSTVTIHGDYLNSGPGQLNGRISVKLGNGTFVDTMPDPRSEVAEDAKN